MALGGLVLLYGPYRYFTVKRLMDAGYFRPNFWVRISALLSQKTVSRSCKHDIC